ncbi:MAG: DUF4147 domain-containing protein [Gammaproteobacteria bacterium]|nr:DUF4147 domain-containing protein [Gammaproteobacteria bacterium]
MTSPRDHLLAVYRQALLAVRGEERTRQALLEMGLTAWPAAHPLAVVAIGKAAESMMRGALSVLGERMVAGLVITKQHDARGEALAHDKLVVMTAGHPLPDQHSLAAGGTLLAFMDDQPPQVQFVFLISGGASSLVEVLPEGVSLDQLQRVNHWLLSNGWGIAAMNRVRQRLSCIKGGRLARWLKGRKATCLLISDVPGDRPEMIGSGLLFADGDADPHDGDAYTDLPAWITALPPAPPAPRNGDACFDTLDAKIIACLDDATQAAADAAKALGYAVIRHRPMISGDTEMVGRHLAQQLCDTKPAFHIWGGETSLCLPPQPGRGGRNQHMALVVASALVGRSACYFLAAGTDGTDGPTQDAGALVDAQSIARARRSGLDPAQALREADAGNFLAASGDLIRTGPTGTNVMDLMLGLKLASPS